MEFDVRGQEETITSIRVAPTNRNLITADTLMPTGLSHRVHMRDSDSGDSMTINGTEHAKDLIKGIQKAIDLGWFN